MEAKDTVMDFKQFKEVYSGKEWKPVVEYQAEISFKAGMQEVVEWARSNCHYQSGLDSDTGEEERHIREILWQAKLKEWGVE